mmetsp:Transcript_38115/g.90101  ORF Transcript_38115/g.90101 Transcript_38115/m.90101 type:complete len:401 (+) Transcript_38115:164-1366(+)
MRFRSSSCVIGRASSSSSPSSSISSPLLSSVSILGGCTRTRLAPMGVAGPKPRGVGAPSRRSRWGASSNAVACELMKRRMSSVERCSTTPRNSITLASLMMGLPLGPHWKESLVLISREHPSSSYMRRMILSTSRTLEPSSSSSSNSSSPLACVCASCSSSRRSMLFFACSSPGSFILFRSTAILCTCSARRSSSWLSSLTNLKSLKFCSSASRKVVTSSSMSLSPVASCSLANAFSKRSTSALEASYLAVSSCSWAFSASSSSVSLLFFASASILAFTWRRRFSSESISSSRLRHSASNSAWHLVSCSVASAIFLLAALRVSSATLVASMACAISAFFWLSWASSLACTRSKLMRSFRRWSISARRSLFTTSDSLNRCSVCCTRFSSISSFFFILESAT